MTREEAIRIFRKEIECLSHAKCEDCILEKVCDPAKTTPLDSEYIEAYGMAIKALSQEPTDAISREWLMRKATERFYTTNYFNHISAMIEEAPSVTQKSGHWIKAKPWMIDNTSYKWECSECEKSERFRHNYCPNCGAKMESEDRTE